MKASSDHLLLQAHENTTRKFRGQPTFKVYYGMMRKAALIASVQQRGFKQRMIVENGNKYDLEDAIENEDAQCEKDFADISMAITEIKTKGSTKDNFKVQSQEIKTFSNELEPRAISPVQQTQLHRAFHTYKYQKPPRMAIVLPKPRQGRTAWVDPIDYIRRMRQYSGYPHMRMKVSHKGIWCLGGNKRKKLRQDQLHTTSYIAQKLYDIIGSLQSAADSCASTSQIPASSIKPKPKTAYDLIQRFILIIITIIVFYLIWTSDLPEEILLTFSGMYTFLIIHLYSLVN